MEKLAFNLQLLLICGVLALASLSWTHLLRYWFSGSSPGFLSRPPQHPPVRWGGIDLGICMLLFVVFSIGVAQVVEIFGINPGAKTDATRGKAVFIFALGLAQIAAVVLGTTAVCVRAQVSLRDSGWSFDHFFSDVVLGLFAFGLVVVPVFIVQALLVQVIEYEHPAITPFKQSKDWVFFASAAFSAVIAAPLGEEFFFRGMLQGWFERFALLGARNWEEAIFPRAERVTRRSAPTTFINESESAFPSSDVNPYAFESQIVDDAKLTPVADFGEPARPIPHWPIWVTSAIFALLHMAQGPAPVPLFLFSVALGYVYRHTGRILPSLVMHVTLNGLSMATLALTTLAPPK